MAKKEGCCGDPRRESNCFKNFSKKKYIAVDSPIGTRELLKMYLFLGCPEFILKAIETA